MKLYFEPLTEPIVLSDEYVFELVIENQGLFYKLCTSFYEQNNKNSGFIVLSDEDGILDISKCVDLMMKYIPFEVNRKELLQKLSKKLSDIAKEKMLLETDSIMSEISKYLYELVYKSDLNLTIDDIDILSLIKISNVRFDTQSEELVQIIYEYCKIVLELEKDKLFVFVNLRSFLNDEQFFSLSKTLVDHKVKALCLDTVDRKISGFERKMVIDSDLCII